MKIAVTGAFSYSGKYITRRLLAQGHEVRTLTGHPQRADPFAGSVKVFPLNFDDQDGLERSMGDIAVLVNTFWVRFDAGSNTQARAVDRTRSLVRAAGKAGVRRIVHISITNPSLDSPLPYFRGKAEIEQIIHESGASFAILRPTVLFGAEDVLINNIAFLLRRLPIFGVPGDGSYRLQPVFVDDVAAVAVEAVTRNDNYTIDAVGPDTFAFREMVQMIGRSVGVQRPIVNLPPWIALGTAKLIGAALDDVLLTSTEVSGLMANLLVSREPPRCPTHLEDWLKAHQTEVGQQYASELNRHYR